MGSQLEAIFNKIAEVGINIEGTPIVGRNLADISTIVNSTPIRIISPLSDKNEGKKAARMTLGRQSQVDWIITDLLLYKLATDGSGLEYNMHKLTLYQGAYVDAMLANYELGFARHVKITDIDVEIGSYQYPLNSGKFYHGAKATLIVHEIIP